MPKTLRSSLTWLLPAALLGVLASLGGACGSGDSSDGSSTCTPGAQINCGCPGGTQGFQVCSSDGASYGTCQCGDTTGAGGEGSGSTTASGTASTGAGMIGSSLCEGGSNNGVLEGNEECDDGNDNNNDGCTTLCKLPYCGDGFVQTGEACDDGGAQGEFDQCPDDCDAGGGTGGAGGGGNCEGQLVYAGMTSTQATAWTYGAKTGIEAGHLMCQQLLGADHVCEYAEVQAALANGELDGDPTLIAAGAGGVTIWVHRLTPETVDPVTHHPDPNGDLSQPGAGGRCNEWIYTTNHISDGEYATITHDGTSASATFMLDHDTFYGDTDIDPDTDPDLGHTIDGELQCNGMQRRIPCCYPKCIP